MHIINRHVSAVVINRTHHPVKLASKKTCSGISHMQSDTVCNNVG